MTDVIVETNNLTKAYNGTTVVNGINLRVNENEVFGLLGPNGAGKTTTILMLLGLTEPTSGEARVCGFNSTREPLKVKSVVGYMPEKVGFYDNLTARENLDFIAQLNNISYEESQRRTEKILKSVGLDEMAEKPLGHFSRGMKQRLGVADVLIKQPKVAILDEPTAGLDPEGINQILELVADLAKSGTSVIMSSHRLYEVQKVCHSIGILSKGNIVVQGSIDELGREAMAGGRYQVELQTAETTPELLDTIKAIKGVLKVEIQEDRLLISTDSDLRTAIAKAVVQKDIPLIQMKIQDFSPASP